MRAKIGIGGNRSNLIRLCKPMEGKVSINIPHHFMGACVGSCVRDRVCVAQINLLALVLLHVCVPCVRAWARRREYRLVNNLTCVGSAACVRAMCVRKYALRECQLVYVAVSANKLTCVGSAASTNALLSAREPPCGFDVVTSMSSKRGIKSYQKYQKNRKRKEKQKKKKKREIKHHLIWLKQLKPPCCV